MRLPKHIEFCKYEKPGPKGGHCGLLAFLPCFVGMIANVRCQNRVEIHH